MKTIAPPDIYLSWRVLGFRKEFLLLLTALGTYDLDDPDSLLPERTAWEIFTQCRKNKFSEEGIPKLYGEVLLAGSCHQPEGKAAPTCTVSLRLGPISKQLLVLGDRQWVRQGDVYRHLGEPKPFVSMPLDWERAFGGPGFDGNIKGTGMTEVLTDDGRKVVIMPNVEYPDQLIVSPKDCPTPASFESHRDVRVLDPKRHGTYDDRWLVEDWPNVASDSDLTVLNWAMSDQILNGVYFTGDETIELTNLHPTESVIHSRLPGQRVRFFLRRTHMAQTVIDNRLASLDTVWLFPEIKKAVVAWRSVVSVSDEDASLVSHLVVLNERLSEESKNSEAYEQLVKTMIADSERQIVPRTPEPPQPIEAETEEKQSEAPAMPIEEPEAAISPEETIEEPSLPAGMADVLREAEEETARLTREIETHLKNAGLDSSALTADIPPPMPDPEMQTPEEAIKQVETACAQAREHLDSVMAKIGMHAVDGPEDFSSFSTSSTEGSSPEEILAAMAALGTDESALRELRDAFAKGEAEAKALFEQFPHTSDEEPQSESPPEASESTPPPPEPADTPLTADDVKRLHEEGQSLAGLDLTGLDLSHCDLSGADLTGAILERAILREAILSHAKLDDAFFAGACLDGANLTEASLTGIQGDSLSAQAANFTGANCKDADLNAAKLGQAVLTSANLQYARLTKTDLTQADLTGVRADFARFSECTAPRANFTQAHLVQADFTAAQLDEADFTKVHAPKIDLSQANGVEVNFSQALLVQSRSVGDTKFPKARFESANLNEANWMATDFTQACFDNATMVKTMCNACIFQEATLLKTIAKRGRFDKCDFTRADMRGINLYCGSARFARFGYTDIRRANLYSADVYKALFHKTQLEETNIRRTLLGIGAVKVI
ncbi:DUF2169 family type VI secretion system accessory protein [Desulfovibrio inopinatus]|uniref:DUF2169 family type VI secretion system accessory protein n=1 Tax=Desulfovibrio inopinatus TaxID=102109 RepID=UPI000425D1C3|nr:DUF2169 domain-containing protein [Desulfovibrio inopinatus]